MFWVAVYFFATYGCIGVVIFLLELVFRLRRIKANWRLPIYVVLALLPLLPYIAVTVRTLKYQSELLPALRSSEPAWGFGGRFLKVRILSMTKSRAQVYVQQHCDGGMGSNPGHDKAGLVITLKRISTGWEFDEYDAVYSDCGSAEGNTFPPYPEARSF